MIDNYLEILEDSLQKKAFVLDEIAAYNKEQERLLKKEDLSIEELDENMDKKDALVQKIEELDQGFESLYERIREQLVGDQGQYKAQIGRMQDLISSIMEKSASIQAQEARNKKLIDDYFVKERGRLKQGRQTSKAAFEYYKSMSNSGLPPGFYES